MFIKDFYRALVPGTAGENTRITVITWRDRKILWQGCAKDLVLAGLDSWGIVEMLIDYSDNKNHTASTPAYNYGKILLVI